MSLNGTPSPARVYEKMCQFYDLEAQKKAQELFSNDEQIIVDAGIQFIWKIDLKSSHDKQNSISNFFNAQCRQSKRKMDKITKSQRYELYSITSLRAFTPGLRESTGLHFVYVCIRNSAGSF